MSSTFVVAVAKAINLREHPNASLLGLADVLGYQMVIPLVEDPNGSIVRTFLKDTWDEKGKRVAYEPETTKYSETVMSEDVHFRFPYLEGQLIVYFPADSVLPAELVDKLGVRSLMKGLEKNRVGRVRLRGEPSFGLIVSIPDGMDWKEGDNVADYFGATKYDPPLRMTAGDAAPRDVLVDPFFYKFTNIENGRVFMDVFTDGEEVIITEKIHGTNTRVGVVNNTLVAGSMEVRRSRPTRLFNGYSVECELDSAEVKTNTYWFPFSLPGVSPMLNDLAAGKNNIILYGEVYGGSIQSLAYGIQKGRGLGFRVFGLTVNGTYMDWDDLVATCQRYGVETVPVLYRGQYSFEVVKHFADGKTTMTDDGQIREGIVVYSLRERQHPKIGRVVLKFIGTEYALSKHQERDTKDV